MHMDLLTQGMKDILLLSNSITKRQYKKDGWNSILNTLSDIFKSDGAFIGLWEQGFIKLKYSSSLIKSFDSKQYTRLKRVDIKDRKIFKDALVKDGYIKIEDYEHYQYALDEWKSIGLKSLLAVTIRTRKKIYGSLHIVNIKNKLQFKNEHIQILKIIADTIASEIEKETLGRQLKNERDINAQYVKLFNSIALDNEIPDNLNGWVSSTLYKIKELIEANTIKLIMPSEDMYVSLNADFSTILYDEFKKSSLYDLWKQNSADVSEYSDEFLLKRCDRSPKIIRKAIVIPVISNNETIAMLCAGFDKKDKTIDKQRLLLVATILKYFTSLIYTYKNISRISFRLSNTETGLIKAFVSSVEAKDPYTKGHSEHVAIYAKNIGSVLCMDDNEIEALYNAGLLHDIGKIGIPDNILLKPGRLTEHEYEIMKLHPIFSYEIIKNIPKFEKIANCIRHHHEKLNGEGYPDKLKEEKIEMGAKILTIADIFDALTTERPYRKALNPDEAIMILQKESVDKDILKKSAQILKNSYASITKAKTKTFIPSQLEIVRKDLIKRDYMTGLYRRAALVEFLNKYIKDGKDFSLFMVDIKNISYINYRYGVEIGDKIITFVADELSKIEDIDSAARTGSDVFMFIYNGKDSDNFKEKLSKKLKSGMISRIKQKSCVIDEKEAEKIIGCYITYTTKTEEINSAEKLIYLCLIKKKRLYLNNEDLSI